jgi:hypothetical protein
MKRTIFSSLTAGLLFCLASQASAGDWVNFIWRPSGLGWSDGYHAQDQCPPRTHGHFPVRHPVTFPAWGAAHDSHAPYYFEEPGYKSDGAKEANELLPSAEPKSANPRIPSPQARYQPRNRYFETLHAEQQSQLQQARR